MTAPHPALLVRSGLDDAALRRATARGDLVRVASGRHVRSEHWETYDENARHAMRAIAVVSRMASPKVLSHASAGAAWGFPRLGPLPARVEVIDPAATIPQTTSTARKHAGPLGAGDVVERYGVPVTTAARTTLDLVVSGTLRQAVVVLDHALRTGLTDTEDLVDRLLARGNCRNRKRARRAIDFATPLAESPGESLSRLVIAEAGLEPPHLQHAFSTHRGRFVVDFWWPAVGDVGEFDGETKYLESDRWSGRSAAKTVLREKYREDAIRGVPGVRAFVRWSWRDALTPAQVPTLLARAGVSRCDVTSRAWCRVET
ncbi:hypothetical protein AS850_05400 [Frondihabitans sp. 762G35]|uniref:hypothetical protein n=1 Tax=Frondihabitans sp. 762G35 TaxID=1446794 RepID=UPI000D2098EA|nr:hypothetical protein [Frondihabitans sp. 762G35]ARC56508.1 hypothetical protein AS850_05400 [Frondihabitans sp. 762G35]